MHKNNLKTPKNTLDVKKISIKNNQTSTKAYMTSYNYLFLCFKNILKKINFFILN
jgi:hypothetical protein